MVRAQSAVRKNYLSISFVILILLAALLLGTLRVQAKTNTVRVWADAGWVDTGINLTNGDTVELKANGLAITGPLDQYPGAKSGPSGQPFICSIASFPYDNCALEGAPYGALVGKIGSQYFLIGDASSFVAPASGTLYLAVNDNLNFYNDNLAGFSVLFK